MEGSTPLTEPGELLIPDLVTPDFVAHHLAGHNPCPVPPAPKENKNRRKELGNRNLLPIPNTAATSLRYGQSPTETAAIASAFLLDLINGGILPAEYSYLALDKNKVQRARSKMMKVASETGVQDTLEDEIKGIFFDGRKNLTRVMIHDEQTGRYHPRLQKQNHIAVTSEPDGNYRFHFTPPEAVPPSKPAREEALALFNWMVKHEVDKTVG